MGDRTGGPGPPTAPPPWRPLHVAMVGQKGLPATFGGIEHHVEQVGQRLAARGHRVSVYCRSSYGHVPTGEYKGMHLVPAPTIGTKHLDAIVHSLTSTAKALAVRADVVHYHALGPGLVAPLPRYLSGAKVVLTVHGLDHQRAKWNPLAQTVLGAAHWMSGRVPDRVIVVSRDLEEHYREAFGRDATYIANGVARWAPVRADAIPADFGLREGRYALYVGRLVPEKRADLLIRAFQRVEGDHQLAIVGDSSFSDGYSQQLRDLAASDPRIVFTGFAFGERLAALYQHAGAFVTPSSLEGLPLTLLEAVSSDAAVLASDIAPHREVIRGGSARHRLVPVDDPTALAVSLQDLLHHPPPVDQRSRDLRAAVLDHYSWETAVDELEGLYLSALTGKGRHGRRQDSRDAMSGRKGHDVPA